MLKADLKQVFGSYCDTDKLVDDTMSLLTKYHYRNTEHGVCTMLYSYFMQKKPLIDLFMTSENYVGNMRICLNVELERRNNSSEVSDFCYNFSSMVDAKVAFLKYVDEQGKTMDDYIRTGIKKFKARALYYSNIADMLFYSNEEWKQKFDSTGATQESRRELNNFGRIMEMFAYNTGTIVTEDFAQFLREQPKMNANFASGMKTSRAFNRICSNYGVDRLPNYNKLFAHYSDMVSGLKRKICFYISLNPLDYLTMSFGNSWSSCHTIDKKNEREMPNSYQGMHCGGVMSYMLDRTSIITYVYNHATENHEEGKIYRNMFHYHDGTLIQGRIYPQDNDGATDLYTEFRQIVQSELARLLKLDNNDWIRRNRDCCGNTSTRGVHYDDYNQFHECNVSYPREMPWSRDNVVEIGHERICPNCGDTIDDGYNGGMLTHEDCVVAV